MIPKKPAPDLIRGGYRFSEKIMLKLTLAAVLLGARCEPNCGPDLAAGFIGEWPFAYNAQL